VNTKTHATKHANPNLASQAAKESSLNIIYISEPPPRLNIIPKTNINITPSNAIKDINK